MALLERIHYPWSLLAREHLGDLGGFVRRPKRPRKAPSTVERLHGTDLKKNVGREQTLELRDGFV